MGKNPCGRPPNTAEAIAAVREALDVLRRASADWRNGNTRLPGPVHWTAAIPAAWEALSRALELLEATDTAPTAARTFQNSYAGDQQSQQKGADGKLIQRIDAVLAQDADDAAAGMHWYNGLTPTQRRQWHEIAGSAVPAVAWRAFQAGGSQR